MPGVGGFAERLHGGWLQLQKGGKLLHTLEGEEIGAQGPSEQAERTSRDKRGKQRLVRGRKSGTLGSTPLRKPSSDPVGVTAAVLFEETKVGAEVQVGVIRL